MKYQCFMIKISRKTKTCPTFIVVPGKSFSINFLHFLVVCQVLISQITLTMGSQRTPGNSTVRNREE